MRLERQGGSCIKYCVPFVFKVVSSSLVCALRWKKMLHYHITHDHVTANELKATSATSNLEHPPILDALPKPSTPSLSAPLTTLYLNSPITLPGGSYSHTKNHPNAAFCALLLQYAAPHPTRVVFCQTSWVKWPVDSEKSAAPQL